MTDDTGTDGRPPLRLSTYADVAAALGNPDLSRSLDKERYETGNILEGVVMMLDGAEHRERRRIESKLFRREVLGYYEHELFPRVISASLAPIVAAGEADLVSIGALLAVVLSARTAGIDFDATSLAEREELARLVTVFARAISIDATIGDTEGIRQSCREGLTTFSRKYLRASLAARARRLAEGGAGERGVSQSADLISTLLANRDELNIDDDQFLRETAFFLEAGAHTTSQTLASAMHYTFGWIATHPGDTARLASDTFLIQRFVHEALRLRPTNPRIRRRALTATVVAGRKVEQGTFIELDTAAANRDPSVFGEHAEEFDPFREVPAAATRWGHSFGGGAHACIGRNLAIGTPTRFERPPTDQHMVGMVPLMIQGLLAAGVAPHPARQPTPDTSTHRWTRWAQYPVTFGAPAR